MTNHRTPLDLTNFQYRMIRDAMNEAMPAYWRRRADAYRTALPREGDFTGSATQDDLRDRLVRVASIITTYERHALFCELTTFESDLILDEMARCIEQHRQQVAA